MAAAREGTRDSHSAATKRRRSWWSSLRRIAFWVLLVAAAGLILGRILIREQLELRIRQYAEGRIEQLLPGISVDIHAARRVRGRGIELRGIRLFDRSLPVDQRELLTIDRVMLAAPTEWSQLIAGGGFDIFGVAVDGLRIRAMRGRDGKWNLEHLRDWKPPENSDVPRITIRDARIELADAARAGRPIELHGISADIERKGDSWQLKGRLAADRFGRVALVAEGDRKAGSWSLHGTLSELDVSSELRRLLPPEIARSLSTLEHVRARGELRFTCRGGARGVPRFSVKGTIRNGRLDDARLPYPLNDISARIHVDNDRMVVSDGTARMAGATVRVEATVEQWLVEPRVRLDVSASDLTLEPRLRSVLTERARRVWDQFRPSGPSDLRATVEWAAESGLRWDATVRCRDVSIVYAKCPYPLHHLQGEVRFGPNYMEVLDLMASAAGTPLHIAASMRTIPGSWTGEVSMWTDGTVPIDRRLVGALSPSAQEFLVKLEPTGRIELRKARFWRPRHGEPVQSEIEIGVVNGSLVFSDFPYPLTRVQGTLEGRDREWSLVDFQAQHGTTRIHASGKWHPEDGIPHAIDLTLELVAVDVDLDPDLRAAMSVKSPHVEALWNSLRPRGVIDRVTAYLRYRTSRGMERFHVEASESEPRSSSTSRTVAVHPTWFPYLLERLTGRFEYEQGRLEMREVSAWHGETQVRLDGLCEFRPDGSWSVRWNRVSADRVTVNQSLLRALPGAFGRALASIRLEGLLVLDGTMGLAGRPGRPPLVDWNVRVDVADGRMQAGLPFEQIHGGAQLYGQSGPGTFVCQGELDIDSVHVRGVQVSRIRGPLQFDSQRLLLGAWSESGRRDRPPRSLTARVFGGQMTLDGQFLMQKRRPYDVQLALTGASLVDLLQQFRGRAAGDLRGKLEGNLRLRGEAQATHARRGSGVVRLREASLYELPVVVALLSVLSLKSPDRTAFEQADIDFRVEGDQILLDRIDLVGNAITLKGRGWANFQQEILLDFYSLVGRDEYQIPLLRYVLAEASKRILEIRVAGTLSDPRVQGTAFPELDETLRRLFPELGRLAAPTGNGEPLRRP